MGKLVPSSWLALLRRPPPKTPAPTKLSVLAFEAATLMSKSAHLHRSLSPSRISLLHQTLLLPGVRKLVSDSDTHLLSLAVADFSHSLSDIITSLSRFSARCADPELKLFQVSLSEFLKSGADPYRLSFSGNAETKIRKMERLAASTSALYQELEVLAELEQALRRTVPGVADCRRRVAEQRLRVKCLREDSLWGRSYDYAVRLLAGAVFAIVERIRQVFGFQHNNQVDTALSMTLHRSNTIAAMIHPSDGNSITRFASGPLPRAGARSGPMLTAWKRNRWPGRPFGECMAGGNEPAILDSCVHSSELRRSAGSGVVDEGNDGFTLDLSFFLFGTKRKLMDAPEESLGAAALALHYANVIIVIERFVATPHLIGPDARDDLYYMLPTSIRVDLRARLKSYAKSLALCVYDPVLAAEWTEAVARILEWLAPLAHNMIKWQSERNFEQQHLVSSTNVLLLQTLYFADRMKTEAAITELLVGLNYMWRFGRELNAKAMCVSFSSRNYDDCLDPNE